MWNNPGICVEHTGTKTQHEINEWNSMVAVRVCVNYVNRLDVHQQKSLCSDANRKIVRDFMKQVEKELLANLPPCPSFATTGQLRNALIARYGRRFADDTSSSSPNSADVTDDDDFHVPYLRAVINRRWAAGNRPKVIH